MPQVFVSYSHQDKLRARELCTYLRRRRVRVFQDEFAIGLGERISEAVADALNASHSVVLLASGSAMVSGWVRSELDAALTLEMQGKCRLLVVKLDDARLPSIVSGKKFLGVQGEWTRSQLAEVHQAIQPNIYRNGWSCSMREFAGNGGSCIAEQYAEGMTYFRLRLQAAKGDGFAGACWEFNRGGVDVSNYSHFKCRLRRVSNTRGTRLQVKFETRHRWPTWYVPFPPKEWRETAVALKTLGKADWSALERVTVAVDDRDVHPGPQHIIDVAEFEFFRKRQPNKPLHPILGSGTSRRPSVG